MSHRGREPAGLPGLRKKLQRQKKGPWSLGERKSIKCACAKETVKVLAYSSERDRREREHEHTGSFGLRAFIWRSQGRISIKYSSVFWVCLLRVLVSTD